MGERLEPTLEQSRELHESLAQLANSAKPGNTELILKIEYAKECSRCNEVVTPDVEYIGNSADYAHYDVTWDSKCGTVGVIQVGWDWGEETILNNNKRGNPEIFSQKPSFPAVQQVFEEVTGSKLPSLVS